VKSKRKQLKSVSSIQTEQYEENVSDETEEESRKTDGVTTEDIKTSLNEVTTHRRDSSEESESLSDNIVRMISKKEQQPLNEARKSDSSSNKYDEDDFIGKIILENRI